MHRLFIFLTVVALTAALAGAPAGALARIEHPVNGSYTGSWGIRQDVACSDDYTVTVRGNGDIAPFGSSSFVLIWCDLAAHDSFTLTAPDGTVSGNVTFFGFTILRQLFRAHFEIAITNGTGRFVNATGNLISDFEQFDFEPAVATMTGAVAFGPSTPTKVSDCRHGGYKYFADDHGRPFRSQLRCVAFVVRPRR
jgi:hypothetical protein